MILALPVAKDMDKIDFAGYLRCFGGTSRDNRYNPETDRLAKFGGWESTETGEMGQDHFFAKPGAGTRLRVPAPG
jgi:hypothetical protein